MSSACCRLLTPSGSLNLRPFALRRLGGSKVNTLYVLFLIILLGFLHMLYLFQLYVLYARVPLCAFYLLYVPYLLWDGCSVWVGGVYRWVGCMGFVVCMGGRCVWVGWVCMG